MTCGFVSVFSSRTCRGLLLCRVLLESPSPLSSMEDPSFSCNQLIIYTCGWYVHSLVYIRCFLTLSSKHCIILHAPTIQNYLNDHDVFWSEITYRHVARPLAAWRSTSILYRRFTSSLLDSESRQVICR